MKLKLYISVILVIICNHNVFTQNTCLPGSTTFNSQVNVDDFLSDNPSCTEIEGNVLIQGDDINSLAAFSNIISINGDLTIRICDSLPNLEGLNNLTSIGGKLYIDQNPSLNSIAGLNYLTSIDGSFTIRICDMLTNLDGLNNLQSINGKLYIRNNDALENLDGIQNIDPNTIENSQTGSTDLTISINPSLSQCAVESICNFLLLPNKTHSIGNNATGCDNSDEITNNCTGLGLESINNWEEKINVFPIPSINNVSFTISDDLNLNKIVLLNSMGMVIKKLSTRGNVIDISYLSDGCYVLLFYTDKSIYRRTFIKTN